jgi:hypothetical protein
VLPFNYFYAEERSEVFEFDLDYEKGDLLENITRSSKRTVFIVTNNKFFFILILIFLLVLGLVFRPVSKI